MKIDLQKFALSANVSMEKTCVLEFRTVVCTIPLALVHILSIQCYWEK